MNPNVPLSRNVKTLYILIFNTNGPYIREQSGSSVSEKMFHVSDPDEINDHDDDLDHLSSSSPAVVRGYAGSGWHQIQPKETCAAAVGDADCTSATRRHELDHTDGTRSGTDLPCLAYLGRELYCCSGNT